MKLCATEEQDTSVETQIHILSRITSLLVLGFSWDLLIMRIIKNINSLILCAYSKCVHALENPCCHLWHFHVEMNGWELSLRQLCKIIQTQTLCPNHSPRNNLMSSSWSFCPRVILSYVCYKCTVNKLSSKLCFNEVMIWNIWKSAVDHHWTITWLKNCWYKWKGGQVSVWCLHWLLSRSVRLVKEHTYT